jgi:hypothetical protein
MNRFDTSMVRIFVFLTAFILILVSCKKSGNLPDDDPDPSDSSKYILTHTDSRLVTDLNGYRFDAAFTTSEPANYPFLWVQYADDYLDSTRLLVLIQNDEKTITQYMVTNNYNGNMTRKFDHASLSNNAESMVYNFNHEMFLLNSYDPETGTISETGTVFGMNTQVSQIYTGVLDQYGYQFMNRYLIRYISGISLWPFNYPNWSDQPQFIATSELSEPKAIGHYFDETWTTWPYDVQSNMYSGFFQSTYDGTYIGISKGTTTLDTIFLNTNPPEWYNVQVCKAYVDKVADTIYLGVIINVPNTIEMRASLYKMDLTSNQMIKLYSDITYPYGYTYFRKGSFYAIPPQGGQFIKINKQGLEENIPLPATTYGISLKFSRNKIFAIIREAGSDARTEVYSRLL